MFALSLSQLDAAGALVCSTSAIPRPHTLTFGVCKPKNIPLETYGSLFFYGSVLMLKLLKPLIVSWSSGHRNADPQATADLAKPAHAQQLPLQIIHQSTSFLRKPIIILPFPSPPPTRRGGDFVLEG